MKAVIMAGGFGTRLQPLTQDFPKPMAPLLGTPVILYSIFLLKKYGIHDITITLHYLPEKIKSYLGDGKRFGVSIHYSYEKTPLGTAGSIRKAFSSLDEPIIVISGDALTNVNLANAISFHTKRKSLATILIKKVAFPSEYGIVLCGYDGKIHHFLEKPDLNDMFSNLANTGMYILEPEIMQYIPDNMNCDFSKDIFPKLLSSNIPMFGYEFNEYWCDIGDLSQYRQAQYDILDRTCDCSYLICYNKNHSFISPKSNISLDATIQSPCYIGQNVTIDAGAYIFPYSIIEAGSHIKSGAHIDGAIIGQFCDVAAHTEIKNAIIGNHVTIGTASSVYDDSVIGHDCDISAHTILGPSAIVWPNDKPDEKIPMAKSILQYKNTGNFDFYYRTYFQFNMQSPDYFAAIALFGQAFTTWRNDKKILIAIIDTKENKATAQVLCAALEKNGCTCLCVSLPHLHLIPFLLKKHGMDSCIGISSSAKINIFDSNGEQIQDLRKLYKLFHDPDQTKCNTEMSWIESKKEILSYEKDYFDTLLSYLDIDKMRQNPKEIITYGFHGKIDELLKKLYYFLGWNVKSMDQHNHLYAPVPLLGILYDQNESVIHAITSDLQIYSPSKIQIITAYFLAKKRGEQAVYLPHYLPNSYLKFIWNQKLRITHNKKENDWLYKDPIMQSLILSQIAIEPNFQYDFLDLTDPYKREVKINCNRDQIGSSFKKLTYKLNSYHPQFHKGIHFKQDNTWVHITADRLGQSLKLTVEGMNSEISDEIATRYSEMIKKTLQ